MLESRTVAAGAADGLGEDPVAVGRGEGVDLQVRLLAGAHIGCCRIEGGLRG